MRGFQRDFDFGAKLTLAKQDARELADDAERNLKRMALLEKSGRIDYNASEAVKKDRALELLEATRAELIAEAKVIAADLCSVRGRVTSVAVLEVMRRGRYAEMLSEVDARFMGAVFQKGWRRIGYEPLGSHCRPVSVWERV